MRHRATIGKKQSLQEDEELAERTPLQAAAHFPTSERQIKAHQRGGSNILPRPIFDIVQQTKWLYGNTFTQHLRWIQNNTHIAFGTASCMAGKEEGGGFNKEDGLYTLVNTLVDDHFSRWFLLSSEQMI